MRISIISLSLGALLLVVLGPFGASAHDIPSAALHKRMTGAGSSHKRIVNSRTIGTKREDALAALQLLNRTIVDKAESSGGGTPSGVAKALGGPNPTTPSTPSPAPVVPTKKFPELGFEMPSTVPTSTDNWWTDQPEYGFLGFSYEVTACQSPAELKKDFMNIRNKFDGRYVRLYGACDKKGFYDDVADAAWEAALGVHSLIWFGFDGGNQWKTRRDTLFATLKSNPKARAITRLVQFGSEPLFDSDLTPDELTAQVNAAKKTLKPLGIPVSVSDMVYGFTKDGGAANVLEAIDQISVHELPFFSTKATTGAAAWPLVQSDIEWAMKQKPLKGKKVILDENAWPDAQGSGVQANSHRAVASRAQMQAYFNLLDSKCSYFKNLDIGWMFHVYSDAQEPEYGLYDANMKQKFPFNPKTSC